MYFEFDGINSKKYKLEIESSNHLSKPKKKIELISIPGRTGDLVIDDNSYENLQINLECFIDADNKYELKTLVDEIHKWLYKNSEYRSLIFEDGTKFLAIPIDGIETDKLISDFADLKISFSCIPFNSEEY